MCCSFVYIFDTQCYDVSLGLAYLHENSVIHGDVKPVNILIDENGIPCLCDFGLSRISALLTQPSTTPLDEEKKPYGTWVYMSPEQMVYGTTDEASDVYSFGMTIYEVCNNSLLH
jgi:serine/threonine protein kinase